MPDKARYLQSLESDQPVQVLKTLYGDRPAQLARQRKRYIALINRFSALFPQLDEFQIFSVPGRTEVGGNHTDHNAGRVLAAGVDLDIIAAVAKTNTGVITLQSEGYPTSVVNINQLDKVEAEKNTPIALIRGVCARMKAMGYQIGGFTGYATSDVLKGSGLSSSAAYEIMVVTILSHLYNQGEVDLMVAAQIAQFAENTYFGKPCGLMDQITCAVGGFVTIDFKEFDHPVVKKVAFDFASSGYSLVIVDTGGNHADLTDEYAGVAREMKAVAQALGVQVLRETTLEQVIAHISELRLKVSDRAILRAMHFFRDDQRVVAEVAALEKDQFDCFLGLVIESGYSSWMLNQNTYTSKNVSEQGVSVALAASEFILKGRGAWRVHGGGFAGTIQAFVPDDLLEGYVHLMKTIFGENSCYELIIRPAGAVKVELT
ncbi:MAG TPA: galactokinase family protein [Anaerolineaceae bacterium]